MSEKITALYARYSRDDGQDTENASITNQHKLLQEYAETNGFTNCRFYADDGYTGTNFDRPDFQRMMKDIEDSLIDTIIVKDMSRFGRNYILVGQYIEFILPEYDVRVIGVSDHYDTFNTNNDMFPFENIFNEMYAADISKKIRTTKKNAGMSGIEMKSHPIYGYKVKNGVYYDWEIDEEAAKIVRLIFDMYVNQDCNTSQIAKYLRENEIVMPGVYLGLKREKVTGLCSWNLTTIKRILKKQEYCGDVVNFKTQKFDFRAKKREEAPRENWMIFENRHPAIISREIYQRAQKKLKITYEKYSSMNRTDKNDTYFLKKCVCSYCNKLMAYSSLKGQPFYICQTYSFYHNCELNRIFEKDLRRVVFEYLNKFQTDINNDNVGILNKLSISNLQEFENQINIIEMEIQQLHKLQCNIYEDFYNGQLPFEKYKVLSESYVNRKEILLLESEDIKRKYNELAKKYKDIEKSIKLLKKYADSKELTEEMCDNLIEKIVIDKTAGQGEKNYGKRKINVYIYGIGNLSELIDVSFKKYSDRIRDLAPTLLANNKCNMREVARLLECGVGTIVDALKEENTNFNKLTMDIKKKIIIDSIKNGIPPEEIYKLMGYTKVYSLYRFIKDYMNTTYKELCKNTNR